MDYSRYLDKLILDNEQCSHCDRYVQTLHHKNENRDDNRKANLLPLCYQCHEKLPHKRDINDYYKTKSLRKVKPKSYSFK